MKCGKENNSATRSTAATAAKISTKNTTMSKKDVGRVAAKLTPEQRALLLFLKEPRNELELRAFLIGYLTAINEKVKVRK